jgi:uncharacterized protein with FMN-binding domain
MRRIVVGFMSTISALVLLFSYHTSLGSSSSTAASGGTGATGSTDDSAGGTTSSGGTTASGGTDDSGSSSSGSSSSDSSGSDSSSSDSSSGSSGSGSSSSGSSGTYTGSAVNTRWGVVQVEITVKNGKITKAEAVQYPTENPRDQEINSYAVPQLNSETVDQQSGSIDAVSGATVTSDGYIQSLQSAIDQAHL